MFDTIVFSQKELISAIQNGYRRIGICDNIFVIPEGTDIKYTMLGNASLIGGHYSGAAEEYEGYFVNGYGIKLI